MSRRRRGEEEERRWRLLSSSLLAPLPDLDVVVDMHLPWEVGGIEIVVEGIEYTQTKTSVCVVLLAFVRRDGVQKRSLQRMNRLLRAWRILLPSS
jgi:formylmethanofuran:tetrahydromethanopterin formyltransferase